MVWEGVGENWRHGEESTENTAVSCATVKRDSVVEVCDDGKQGQDSWDSQPSKFSSSSNSQNLESTEPGKYSQASTKVDPVGGVPFKLGGLEWSNFLSNPSLQTRKLSEIAILGSHDTTCYKSPAIGFISDLVVAQYYNIYDQLRAGARLMNFRVSTEGNFLQHYHGDSLGTVNRCADPDEVLKDVKRFFDQVETEFLIIELSHWHCPIEPPYSPYDKPVPIDEYCANWERRYLDKITSTLGAYMYKNGQNLAQAKVSELAGKVIVINRFTVNGRDGSSDISRGIYSSSSLSMFDRYPDRNYYHEVNLDVKNKWIRYADPSNQKFKDVKDLYAVTWQATPDSSKTGIKGVEYSANWINREFSDSMVRMLKSPQGKNPAGKMANVFLMDFIGVDSYRIMETISWYNGLLDLDPKTLLKEPINRVCTKWQATVDSKNPARRTLVRLTNTGSKTLYADSSKVNNGIWAHCPSGNGPSSPMPEINRPCDEIQPGDTCQFGTESWGVATGTNGRASYTYDLAAPDDTLIEMFWNNPYWGENGFDLKVGAKATGKRTTGIKGDCSLVKIEVRNNE
jgi:hypothetical protein